MSLYDFTVNFLAWFITLCILVLPLFFFIKIIKAIIRKIKHKRKKKNLHAYESFEDGWKSDWTWNEKTQLWEHPLSKKSKSEGEPYRYTSNNIPKERNEREQTQIHHTDTTVKPAQQSETKIEFHIPPDVLERINKTKSEPVQETVSQENLTQEEKDAINLYRIKFPQKAESDTYKSKEAEELLQKANEAIKNTPESNTNETEELLKRANHVIYEEKPKKQPRLKNKPQIIYTYNRVELPPSERAIADDLDFMHSYQQRQLFTKNEWQNYKKLKDIAEAKGYVICPKVRLFDLIEPRADKKKKLTYRYKIQAKHVDFVICDRDMNIKAILELDDNSHKDIERIKRDDFVNTILLSVGYTVIHTKYIDYDILDLI